VWSKIGVPITSIDGEIDILSGEAERSQRSNALGLHLFLANISSINPNEYIFPFFGGGLIQTKISESLELKTPTDVVINRTDAEGYGYFFEGGADFLLGPFTLKLVAEYSKIKLNNSSGNDAKEAGGGLFFGGGLSFYSR